MSIALRMVDEYCLGPLDAVARYPAMYGREPTTAEAYLCSFLAVWELTRPERASPRWQALWEEARRQIHPAAPWMWLGDATAPDVVLRRLGRISAAEKAQARSRIRRGMRAVAASLRELDARRRPTSEPAPTRQFLPAVERRLDALLADDSMCRTPAAWEQALLGTLGCWEFCATGNAASRAVTFAWYRELARVRENGNAFTLADVAPDQVVLGRLAELTPEERATGYKQVVEGLGWIVERLRI